jgi:hypothetical protein
MSRKLPVRSFHLSLMMDTVWSVAGDSRSKKLGRTVDKSDISTTSNIAPMRKYDTFYFGTGLVSKIA